MATLLYGLVAALTYGAADFLGGLMSRRVEAVVVVFFSQLLGTLPLLVALAILGGEMSPGAFGWGAASGVAGGAGVLFLFRALGRGRMSALAPITALEAAGLPVIFGVVTGERPRALVLVGAAVALAAVALISSGESQLENAPSAGRRAGLIDALLAGACFGAFFILLGETPDDSGLWPLAAARGGSLTLITLLLIVTRRRPVAAKGTLPGIGAAGALDVAANVAYVLSARAGLVSIAAVLTSLYPGATVILARVFLHEHLAPPQIAGLILGAVGVVLIGVG